MKVEPKDILLLTGLAVAAAAWYRSVALGRMRKRYQVRIDSGEPLTRIVKQNPEKPEVMLALPFLIGAGFIFGGLASSFPDLITMTTWTAGMACGALTLVLCGVVFFLLSRLGFSKFTI